MITAGIDIGSRNTKLVIFDTLSQSIIWSAYQSTEIKALDSVSNLFNNLRLSEPGIYASIQKTCSTGYGRHLMTEADLILSEISCHATGIRFFFPDCRSIIDIGGQDSKIIALDSGGKVMDFVMNDKCAAGTGRFLEMTALRLNCGVDELSGIAATADTKLKLNSTCVVFAESEIIGLMALDTSRANIVRAVHISIAHRISAQIGSLSFEPEHVFTGGVALNSDLMACLEAELKLSLKRPEDPEITGALGAAILAAKD